ncbi:MAG: glycerol-3-phosphate dehydrogenase [Alphaproteobacteria bacterium]|nr:glycerol-3-phosphate dehydrogenase [Alphaproteobacteria bacterium]
MKEGKTDPALRHPIDWTNPDFYDEAKLDQELRRVFDVCHTCRRCIMLCDSFPRLFDAIDKSEGGEVENVKSADFRPVADACTICDMCYIVSCPYVPPHEYALDFPHLMVRYRAVELRQGHLGFFERELGRTDRNGKLMGAVAPLANWAARRSNMLTRPVMESVAGIHRDAFLPPFHGRAFSKRAAAEAAAVNQSAPAFGRKALLYATCFAEYNNPTIGMSALRVLAKNGVAAEVMYPECCGMPQLERGDMDDVAGRARRIAAALAPRIDEGYDVVALIPSCALMLKSEWPLMLPKDENVKKLAQATRDITEYVVEIARKEGLAEGLQPLSGGIAFHHACHSRAQNIGVKAAVMLRLIPKANVMIMQRCSGHGGSWGVMKENFEVGMKVGENVMKQAAQSNRPFVSSECPLAGDHILQGMERHTEPGKALPPRSYHPIELFALAYGFEV